MSSWQYIYIRLLCGEKPVSFCSIYRRYDCCFFDAKIGSFFGKKKDEVYGRGKVSLPSNLLLIMHEYLLLYEWLDGVKMSFHVSFLCLPVMEKGKIRGRIAALISRWDGSGNFGCSLRRKSLVVRSRPPHNNFVRIRSYSYFLWTYERYAVQGGNCNIFLPAGGLIKLQNRTTR